MYTLEKGDRAGLEVAELLAQAGDTLNARAQPSFRLFSAYW
jgi:hypothetical protein